MNCSNKCSICDLKFANNCNPLIQEWYISSFADIQNLKKHIEAVREGIKPFKCSISNYDPLIQEWYLLSFADKQNLKKTLKLFMKESNLSSAVFVILSLQITIIH